VKSLFELRTTQADPNPANYIVTPDNRLALIDFGCVKRFDEKFIEDFKRMLRVYREESRELVLNAYREIGLIDEVSAVDSKLYRKILKFNRWSVEPFLHDEFRFTKEYLKKGVEFAGLFTDKPFNIIKDYVFSDRTIHGLFSLFEEMGVVVDMRKFRKMVF
jgi:predicted unusual protein kinase regulating ubiquinone biosynthesis (AarF/ABC1/UbiB family)